MKAIDLIMKSYLIYLKKYGVSGIEASIIVSSAIIVFYSIFIISFLLNKTGTSLLDMTFHPLLFGLFAIGLYYLIAWWLKQIYLRGPRKLEFGRLLFFYYVSGPVLFITSIFFLVMSFRYM